MRIAAIVLALSLAASPGMARWPHHGLFGGGGHHGHPINAWRGSHRRRLR